MKFVIFACVLAVVAYHEALCESPTWFPAVIEGDCMPEELPQSKLEGCNKIKCEKDVNGGLSFVATTCALQQCSNGKELGSGPHDLTMKYPNCCRPNKCD